MKADFTFKHGTTDEKLKTHALSKAERLKKFVSHPTNMHFVFSHEGKQYQADVSMHVDHDHYEAKVASDSFFTSVDTALEKLEAQLRKHKDKERQHKR